MRKILLTTAAVAISLIGVSAANAGANDPQKWASPPAGWVEVYAGKKFVGYSDPTAPTLMENIFCSQTDPNCLPGGDGVDGEDGDDS